MATPRKKNPQKAGRKPKYKPEFKDMAYKFALLGLTDAEMAALFDVSEATFNTWKDDPKFLESLNAGKDIADAEIASSLYDRAKGYEIEKEVPTKMTRVEYDNGKRALQTEEVVITKVKEIVPPDTRAIQYWMNNRRRRRQVKEDGTPAEANTWADRHEVDHTTDGEKLPATPMVYLPQDFDRTVAENPHNPEDESGVSGV